MATESGPMSPFLYRPLRWKLEGRCCIIRDGIPSEDRDGEHLPVAGRPHQHIPLVLAMEPRRNTKGAYKMG